MPENGKQSNQRFERVATEDGSYTLMHPGYQQTFHSYAGAAKEAEDLYVKASGFAEKLGSAGSLCILDIGLGLGYNALSTLACWQAGATRANIKVVSLEKDRQLVEDLSSGKASWQENWNESWKRLVSLLKEQPDGSWSGKMMAADGGASAEWLVLVGDASHLTGTLAEQIRKEGPYDYFWQDPFSPDANPEMWSSEWFGWIRGQTRADSVLATYSVSRATRDALQAGNWDWKKIETTTSKRQWLLAQPDKGCAT